MSLFSITCTTCKTRLKVRDASAIGQIMACPRCGGMVMVKAPDPSASEVEESSPIDPRYLQHAQGDTIGDSAFEGIDDLLEGRQPTQAPTPTAKPAPIAKPTPAAKPTPPVATPAPAAPAAIAATPAADKKPVAEKLQREKQTAEKPVAEKPTSEKPAVAPATAPAKPAKPIAPKPPGEKTASQLQDEKETRSFDEPSLAPEPKVAPSVAATTAVATPAAAPKLPATAHDPRSSAGLVHSPQSLPGPPGQSPSPSAEESGVTPLPPGDWNERRPWRFGLVVGGSVAAGILLAVGVVIVSLRIFQGKNEAELAEAIPTSSQTGENTAANTPSTSNLNTGNPNTVNPNSNPATPAPAPAETPAETPATEVPAEMPGELPGEMPAEANPPLNPTEVPPVEGPAAAPAIPPRENPGEGPLVDPLPPTPPGEKPSVKPSNPSANPLGQFGELIEGDRANPLPDVEAPLMAGELPIDAMPATADALPRPAPRTVDVAKRLADPIPSIEMSGVPLLDVLDVFSSISTIPITLRADGLPMVKASATAPVTYKGTSTTVGIALRDALTPLGLAYTVDGEQLLVGLREPAELAVIRYPVKDLTTDDPERTAELVKTIREMVTPEAWSDDPAGPRISEEPGILAIANTREAHWQIVLLSEKLRQARRLPQLSRFDRTLFELSTRTDRARATLAKPVMLNFSQGDRFANIVKRLAQTTATSILINWHSLALAGWNPDAEVALLAENIPLETALVKLLAPMDLDYRVIDATTIEIVAKSTAESQTELELYRIDPLLVADPNGETLLAEIAATLPPGMLEGEEAPWRLLVDLEGKCLIARLPQPIQKQLQAEIGRRIAASSSTPATAERSPAPAVAPSAALQPTGS